jgi:hypothetical protein
VPGGDRHLEQERAVDLRLGTCGVHLGVGTDKSRVVVPEKQKEMLPLLSVKSGVDYLSSK